MQNSLSSFTSICAPVLLTQMKPAAHSGNSAVGGLSVCRFSIFSVCTKKEKQQPALLLSLLFFFFNWRKKFGSTCRRGRKKAADLSFLRCSRPNGWTAGGYLIVTRWVCCAQHPGRGWHFSCPKGHTEWVVYQPHGIYASLGQFVTNRCNSLVNLPRCFVFLRGSDCWGDFSAPPPSPSGSANANSSVFIYLFLSWLVTCKDKAVARQPNAVDRAF